MMKTRLKLMPGQKGTKALVDVYGDTLYCVRYRYDEESKMRVKTVEIVVGRSRSIKGQTYAIDKNCSKKVKFVGLVQQRLTSKKIEITGMVTMSATEY